MVSYATTALWGRTEGKETPQRMLNPGTQILRILLTGCGVQRKQRDCHVPRYYHGSGQTGGIYEYPSPSTTLTLHMITLPSTGRE
jgi:hypothetical protein